MSSGLVPGWASASGLALAQAQHGEVAVHAVVAVANKRSVGGLVDTDTAAAAATGVVARMPMLVVVLVVGLEEVSVSDYYPCYRLAQPSSQPSSSLYFAHSSSYTSPSLT